MQKVLIVGGGIAGCATAHVLSLQGGCDVTIVERNKFLGDGVRTHWWGGHPYTYGPRHFLTANEAVYSFFNKYCPLRDCSEHQFISYIEADNQFYNYPITFSDIDRMPEAEQIRIELAAAGGVENAKNLEEYWIASVGKTLYSKMVERYTKKMWMVDDNTKFTAFDWSPKGVAIKEGRAAWSEVFSAYPVATDGYNGYFDLATKDARLIMGHEIDEYDLENKRVLIDGESLHFDFLVSTIPPDILCGNELGDLRFIGRDLHNIVLPMENCFPEDVYFIYYGSSEKFTRIVEYKKFTHHQAENTLIGLEVPSFNGKHYPLPFPEDHALARRYHAMMPRNIFSIGRNGTYKYGVDIDDCIEQAMAIGEIIKHDGWEDPVPTPKHRELTNRIAPEINDEKD